MKFCLLFNLSPCTRYCLLIGSQLTTWSQGNLHYIRLRFFRLDREFFCLLPSLARLYSAAASPSERLRSDGSLAIRVKSLIPFSGRWSSRACLVGLTNAHLRAFQLVPSRAGKGTVGINTVIGSRASNTRWIRVKNLKRRTSNSYK